MGQASPAIRAAITEQAEWLAAFRDGSLAGNEYTDGGLLDAVTSVGARLPWIRSATHDGDAGTILGELALLDISTL